ncbi:hypothetical protein PPYR_01357 [Photinus pyralis]|uniref:MIT domain-containing protein n=1 Tax=Photinus pyralis TaxID=7054 RepID=A0A1Y1KJL3_PHOPY|nr:protein spartin [Photinus pyralis]XP_031357240.1 protein spartin [Photinus pyralis]XP_031357248.1 protein spartin [Photinus pyralis]KAB0804387.1 hypothetical protein PPYR_01357 [Photinus pyralis]
MGNTSSWQQTYQTLKDIHDAAYSAIDTAISLEEHEKPHDAIDKYKEGILLIDKALDVKVTHPENPDFTWGNACDMIQKMKRTRAEVLVRINTISSAPNFVPRESPQENIPTSDVVPHTYTDLANALSDLPVEAVDGPVEIIYTYEGVKLFFISPDGSVAQTSEPQVLSIAVIPATEVTPRQVFLQVGDWIYPLVPGVSPCYRTSFGAFILPDIFSDVPGSSVGIILPADADSSVYQLLEDILHGIIGEDTTLSIPRRRTRRALGPEAEAPRSVSQMISNGLATGGYFVSQGLIRGAQTAGKLLNYGTPKLIGYLRPAHETPVVPNSVVKGFEIASEASAAAVQVTGYVAEKVGTATQALGRYLAPHIQKQGTRLLTSSFNMPEAEASSKLNGLFTVAAGAVEGFSSVYHGLEASASILGNSLSNNTVSVVQHKYGDTAGHLAGNTFNTVGNVISLGHNTKFFTPKGIAKIAAKETGKAVIEDVKFQNVVDNSNTHNIYPNLSAIDNTSTSTSKM